MHVQTHSPNELDLLINHSPGTYSLLQHVVISHKRQVLFTEVKFLTRHQHPVRAITIDDFNCLQLKLHKLGLLHNPFYCVNVDPRSRQIAVNLKVGVLPIGKNRSITHTINIVKMFICMVGKLGLVQLAHEVDSTTSCLPRQKIPTGSF